MKKLKLSNGITLVALIITIIVMLILAGVTISMVSGGEIIDKTHEAKEKTEIAQEKEQIRLASMILKDCSAEELSNKLIASVGENKVEVVDDGEYIVITFKESNRSYRLDEKGNIEPFEIYVDTTPGTLATATQKDENGTDLEVYKIECIEDLVKFQKSAGTYYGKTVVLARTLDFNSKFSYNNFEDTQFGDLNGDGTIEGIQIELTKTDEGCVGFTPINFSGTFDGQGYTIKNIYINKNGDAALFVGFTSRVIKNLTISGNITSSSGYAAGICAGFVKTIEGCTNYANISGINFVGGILAHNDSRCEKISNCINYGTITMTKANYAYSSTGGIAAYGNGITIENCINRGIVSNGILGVVDGSEVKIINSINEVEVKSAGILGWHRNGKVDIINCGNLEKCNSGIVNLSQGAAWDTELELNIKNCYNLGKTTNGIIGAQGTICAKITLNIENCYTAGESTNAILGSLSKGSGTTVNIINTYYDTTKSTSMGVELEGIIGINTIRNNADFLNTLNTNIGENTDWNSWILDKDGYPRSTTI